MVLGCIRHALSKKEKKSLIKRILAELPFLNVSPKKNLEIGTCDSYTVYFYEGQPILVEIEDKLVPLLRHVLRFNINDLRMPKVIVDMGAVKHILNGANIMAPGIVDIEGSFSKGDLVLIIDEKYHKPIAVGLALYSSDEIKHMKRGKVIRNIHYIGDKIWRLSYS